MFIFFKIIFNSLISAQNSCIITVNLNISYTILKSSVMPLVKTCERGQLRQSFTQIRHRCQWVHTRRFFTVTVFVFSARLRLRWCGFFASAWRWRDCQHAVRRRVYVTHFFALFINITITFSYILTTEITAPCKCIGAERHGAPLLILAVYRPNHVNNCEI